MLLYVLAATTNLVPETDILAQASASKMLCTNPDSTTQTCTAIDSYVLRDDGSLEDTGEVLLSPDKPVTLETTSVLRMEKGAVCGIIDIGDLRKGRVRVNGTLLSADRNALVLTKIMEGLKPMAGRKVCEGLRVEDGRLMKHGQVERIDINLPGKPVLWISASDGYKVAPR